MSLMWMHVDYWLRVYHWLYAHLFGYFWLPCPLCGRTFGGHEAPQGALLLSYGSGVSTCPDPACVAEARRRSAEYLSHITLQYVEPSDEELRSVTNCSSFTLAPRYVVLYDGKPERRREACDGSSSGSQ